MNKFFFAVFIFIIPLHTFSQETESNIYSGGMLFFQPGYAVTHNGHQEISDISFGIGGILRFYVFDYITIGVFGGSQKLNYNSSNSQNSYINIGYGGPFVGFSQKSGKFRYTVSVFVGGGTIKNLHIENQIQELLVDAHLYKTPTVVVSPIISLDYALTQKLYLTMQTVCLSAKFIDDKKFLNPALQMGVLFFR
ncbi:MAG: hypothetical protein JXA77_06815 [Bacteroidales bacterium]|nr:hypothetical protein [Bacteroidales bacterium]MBN2819847.1 hypothetical protein [Bacteroidales bacterium]